MSTLHFQLQPFVILYTLQHYSTKKIKSTVILMYCLLNFGYWIFFLIMNIYLDNTTRLLLSFMDGDFLVLFMDWLTIMICSFMRSQVVMYDVDDEMMVNVVALMMMHKFGCCCCIHRLWFILIFVFVVVWWWVFHWMVMCGCC